MSWIVLKRKIRSAQKSKATPILLAVIVLLLFICKSTLEIRCVPYCECGAVRRDVCLKISTSLSVRMRFRRTADTSNNIPIIERSPGQYPHYFMTSYPQAKIGKYMCRNSMCSEFLQPNDFQHYHSCFQKTTELEKMKALGKCRFMNGTQRAAVALASFPGSGNTWVRGLLEQATGICTGSMLCDAALRGSGMNGEGVRSGAVLVVKAHHLEKFRLTDGSETEENKIAVFGAVILIVRNPIHAIVAEWNRQCSAASHVGIADPQYFGENEEWSSFVNWKPTKWLDYFNLWFLAAKKSGHPVLVVRFEDLKRDTLYEVKRMLDFLHVPYTERELVKRLSLDYRQFKRIQRRDTEFDYYTEPQKQVIQNNIRKAIALLKDSNHGDTLGIEEYLDNQHNLQ